MKFPVCIHQAESGSFSGFVPDIPGCYFAGETIDDAIADAHSAIDAHLEYQSEQGESIPFAQTVAAHLDDGDCRGGIWAYVDINLTKYDGKTVKLNITLPQNLLNNIDAYVAGHDEYTSRSGFLAELARREIRKSV